MKFLEVGRHTHNHSYSVGIIGGADGPVSVYCSEDVKRSFRRLLEQTAVAAAAVAAIGGVILLLRARGRR